MNTDNEMTDPVGPTSLPGLDLHRFRAWFADQTTVDGPLRADIIAGGRSNLTYRVRDARSTWILRRPPLGHVLSTAHDMGREVTAMRALAGTDIPVPMIVAECGEDTVLGAPFYVMDDIAGTPYRSATQLAQVGPERTRLISTGMVETLAALHRVEFAAVGLEDFGRPSGFLGRQVRRWAAQLDASRSRDLAGVDELIRMLTDTVPPQVDPGVVHGDYRLDNLLVDDNDEIRAVIDWEMSTLGDPITDLALLLVYHRLAEICESDIVADASNAPGFLTRDEILDVYVRSGGTEPRDGFGFHLGLAYFKLAVILEGIHYRYINRHTVGDGFSAVGDVVGPLVEAGIDQMAAYRSKLR
ncbi:phosphotransferase family protein [Rhodococcus sp. ACT016]|uniref:phosphotransferase family protein n=1 Tax=Rhodococcus sp. ACT016 TaxID=3134808 RepID=UPI003D27ED81